MKFGSETRRLATVLASSGVLALSLAAAPAAVAGDPVGSHAEFGASPPDTSAIAQDRFSELLMEAFQSYPSAIVDFSWHGEHGRIVTTPGMTARIAELADDTVDVVVTPSDVASVTFTGRSEVELTALERFEPVYSSAMAARYEPTSDSVHITIWTDNVDTAQRDVTNILSEQDAITSLAITVEYRTDAPPVEESTTQGGEHYANCTGGFMGYRGASYGIITAAHCTTKPSTYDGDSTGSTYVATGNRDLRFTRLSGGTPQNRTRAGSTTYTNITGVGIVSPGMKLGKYGRSTGYDTDTVDYYAGCLTFTSGNQWCYLYRTDNHVTAQGDSGGPWFWINRAHAVTTGGSAAGSLISPVVYIAYISGNVEVKTN